MSNENEKNSPKNKAIHAKLKGGLVGKLERMINEPASKEWFAKYGLPKSSKQKAVESAKERNLRIGKQHGTRFLSKSEQKEKMKGWPKSDGKGSVAFPKSNEQKREHQRRYGRAWNE